MSAFHPKWTFALGASTAGNRPVAPDRETARKLRARHVRAGCAASHYSPTVSVPVNGAADDATPRKQRRQVVSAGVRIARRAGTALSAMAGQFRCVDAVQSHACAAAAKGVSVGDPDCRAAKPRARRLRMKAKRRPEKQREESDRQNDLRDFRCLHRSLDLSTHVSSTGTA